MASATALDVLLHVEGRADKRYQHRARAAFGVQGLPPAGAPPDRRLAEAIDIVRSKQRRDGRWPLQNRYKGKTFFELERVGTPSRWNTLRALRVLKWWEGSVA